MVTALMGADLNSILKCQKLTDEHVQFLVYQILRGLKVCSIKTCRNPLQLNPQELKKAFKNCICWQTNMTALWLFAC